MSVYHFGDSAIFSDMQLIGQLYRPTVGLLGCTQPKPLLPLFNAGAGTVLTGEMSPEEAALAADSWAFAMPSRTHYVDLHDEDVRLPGGGAQGRYDRRTHPPGAGRGPDAGHRWRQPQHRGACRVTLPPTRVGVVGAGFWAGFQLAAWAEHPDARL